VDRTNGGLARWDEGKLQRLPVTIRWLSLDPGADGGPRGQSVGRDRNGGLHILRDQRFRTIGAREVEF